MQKICKGLEEILPAHSSGCVKLVCMNNRVETRENLEMRLKKIQFAREKTTLI